MGFTSLSLCKYSCIYMRMCVRKSLALFVHCFFSCVSACVCTPVCVCMCVKACNGTERCSHACALHACTRMRGKRTSGRCERPGGAERCCSVGRWTKRGGRDPRCQIRGNYRPSYGAMAAAAGDALGTAPQFKGIKTR